MKRCPWAKTALSIAYHDTEWGVPLHDERGLFEFLILEGAQAGLSWETILRKREHYREAFDGFDPEQIARYGRRKVESLLRNPGIVRNRLKVNAAIINARAYISLRREGLTLDVHLWSFVGGRPIVNRRCSMKDIPPSTPESDAMSKDLRKRGFKFVGSTICYALMQATGMVDDHVDGCFRRQPSATLERHAAT